MSTTNIYNLYHSKVTLQKRIITSKNFTYRNMVLLLNKIISKKDLKILDVGSGVGTLDFYLGNKGHLVVGIDISRKAVFTANQNAMRFGLKKLKFYNGNVNKFKFFSKFDFILCSELIEHVQDDKKLLLDLSKHLKRNGIMLVTTPLDSAPLYRLGITRNFDRRVGHLRRYNLKKMKKLISGTNLKIVKVMYQDGAFRNLFFVFSIFDPLVRIANRFSFISDLLTFIDSLAIKLFGPTDICLIIKRK